MLSRRDVLAAAAVGPFAQPAVVGGAERPLASDVGDMLLLGFTGHAASERSARALASHLAAGRAGGVVFVLENVGTRAEAAGLLKLFGAQRPFPPLLAIDHEGGRVQRLTARDGFTQLPTARDVAAHLTPERARALYATAGLEFARLGFNFNLGPVVDLDDPENPAIGHYGRCFGARPETIVPYATAFVEGFGATGVPCALKHFPGQGLTRRDSHSGLPDLTGSWSQTDVEPFRQLIAAGRVQAVMAGHFRLQTIAAREPTSLSRPVMTGILRHQLGFQGVSLTDDLDMNAIREMYPRKQAVIAAIAAGVDLLMIRNVTDFDPTLPQAVVGWVEEALAAGVLRREQIAASAARVRALRRAAALAPVRAAR